jgi:hypothetical protein
MARFCIVARATHVYVHVYTQEGAALFCSCLPAWIQLGLAVVVQHTPNSSCPAHLFRQRNDLGRLHVLRLQLACRLCHFPQRSDLLLASGKHGLQLPHLCVGMQACMVVWLVGGQHGSGMATCKPQVRAAQWARVRQQQQDEGTCVARSGSIVDKDDW